MPRFLTMVLLTLWMPCFWMETILATLYIQGPHCHPQGHIHVSNKSIIGELSLCDCTVHIHWQECWGRLTLCCMLRTSTCSMHGVLNHNITFIQVLTCILQFLWQLWRTWKAMQHWNIGSNSLGTRLASASHVHHRVHLASREKQDASTLHMKSLKMG